MSGKPIARIAELEIEPGSIEAYRAPGMVTALTLIDVDPIAMHSWP
ncbi:hypothetical protein [Rhizobium mesosinicum]|uniref:Uncharacterized protein n=1 Tax=Rhizobium mesosinicum TaxID=335017 RepID=A0ABS7GP14_9HYPH|nr:hypothetical protein [Rhizobium mesosinicum]MBW9051681.1 hypothetical protein [Rhizobium mesosinicum]